jgi:hypothetical protein
VQGMEVSHLGDSLAKGHVGGVGWVTVGPAPLTLSLVLCIQCALYVDRRLGGGGAVGGVSCSVAGTVPEPPLPIPSAGVGHSGHRCIDAVACIWYASIGSV